MPAGSLAVQLRAESNLLTMESGELMSPRSAHSGRGKLLVLTLSRISLGSALACSPVGHDEVNEEVEDISPHSGLPLEQKLTGLDEEQGRNLCLWTAQVAPGGSQLCANGATAVTRGWTKETCLDRLALLADGCDATVSDHEFCVKESDCSFTRKTELCKPIDSCLDP